MAKKPGMKKPMAKRSLDGSQKKLEQIIKTEKVTMHQAQNMLKK